MSTFNSEIKSFFKKERSYVFLLCLIIFFYVFAFAMHRVIKDDGLVNRVALTEEMQQKEEHLKQEIKDRFKGMSQDSEELEKKLAENPKLSYAVRMFSSFFIIFFALGLWFGITDLKRWVSREEIVKRSHRQLRITWDVTDVLKVIILFVSISTVLNLALALVKIALEGYDLNVPFLILTHTLTMDVVTVLIMISIIRKKGSRVYDLGFPKIKKGSWKAIKKEIWIGFRTYFVIFPVLIASLFLLMFIATLFSFEPAPHPLAEFLIEEHISPWIIFLSLLIACVLGPVIEEIFFRGFVYSGLKKYWGPKRTSMVSAGLFALVHENIFAFLPIFVLGLILCYLYEKRRSLIPSITLHVIHNIVFISYFFMTKSLLMAGNS